MENEFMENRQNYMMDNNSIQPLNAASAGDGVVGGVQAEVVSGVAGDILGGKYDEHHEDHDVGDDDELKYVEEVQQSEKQQQQQLQTLKSIGLDDDGIYESNELAERETSHNAAHDFGNENGGFVFGGDHHHHHHQQEQQKHDLFGLGNGHDTNGHDIVNTDEDFGTLVSTSFEEKLSMMESELDGFKNEGDFLSSSNETGTADVLIPQVDVKIETKLENNDMLDEEEPSSLATNTTNGTSSLSENILPQPHSVTQPLEVDNLMANLEDKENSDPHLSRRPQDLDLEQGQSLLNPDAKEFIPSFGSNPGSPTSPFATVAPQNEPVLSEIMETQMYFGQAPPIVPRHLMEDDDFVAQSPRKGKDDNNMDTVLVPRELSEFEQEADKRPHELEPEDNEGFSQREEVMTPDQAIQQLPLDDAESPENEKPVHTDIPDFQPTSFMDHGPETCVDPETDLDMPTTTALPSLRSDDDVMKRSIYVANDDVIEDVLNSVQPIPTEIDSVNNSFIEESATESAANQMLGDKELLQVEEKEHVSHSPSTEEFHMNLQNNLNSSNKDIPQLPIDMQGSLLLNREQNLPDDHEENENISVKNPFELEDTSKDQQQPAMPNRDETQLHFQEDIDKESENHMTFEENLNSVDQTIAENEQQRAETGFEQENHDQVPDQDHTEKSYLCEETEDNVPETTAQYQIETENFLEDQQEINESYSPFKITDDISTTHAFESLVNETPENLLQQETSYSHVVETSNNLQQPDFNDVDMTPSFIADEKHMLEETKEEQLFSVSGLEEQMSEMVLNKSDVDLSQAEENAEISSIAIEDVSENLINADETTDKVIPDQLHPEQEEAEHLKLVDDSFNRHEQECQLQYEQEQKQKELASTEEAKSDLINKSLEDIIAHQKQEEMEVVEIPMEQQHQEELKSFETPMAQHEQEEMELLEAPIEQQSQEKHESLEASTVQQQQQEEHESEIAIIEEPIVEAKETSTAFTDKETENKTEERHESPLCMVPETAPAEILEPTVTSYNETETEIEAKKEEQTEEIETEIALEPVVEQPKETIADAVKEETVVEPENSEHVPVEAAVVAAAAAVVTTAAIATKAASSPSAKKPLTKTTTTTAKPKVASTTAAKKPVEAAKKPTVLAAKPRAAPAKPAAIAADKKSTTTTANKKPTTASKVVAKSSTTTARASTAAPKTTATAKPTATPRTAPASSSTARKPTTATNGPLAKPRTGLAPTKPTTLGLSATNGAPKTKPLSPRSTLTTQVRKTTSATTAAKSPVKTSATNGVAKTTSSTVTSRTKTSTSTVSSTAGTATKTFTARPAPKFTSSASATTSTTTARRTAAPVSTTTSTLKASSSPLRKSSPAKPMASKTPTKPATGVSKAKTPVSKTASPAAKPAPIRRPVDKTAVANAAATNGEANPNNKQLNGLSEEQLNGDMKAVQQEQKLNGDSSIPMQTEKLEQPFLETRDEQIPMDLINA